MWIGLAFISALCLGFYDVSKKVALRDNKVVDVLTISICFSSFLLSIPLILSRLCPEMMFGTHFYVPHLNFRAHIFTIFKSVIVLSSWVFAYISLKHLPISVVSPMQATRPMWTLIGALLVFGERLNLWQWVGVLFAIGTVFVFSFRPTTNDERQTTNKYYIALALAILIGSCSGLYDKYLMRRYDHNAVQVYYTFYQALMMLIVWTIDRYAERVKKQSCHKGAKNKDKNASSDSIKSLLLAPYSLLPIILISLFLIISDNVYMLALRDPDSMIAVVSTIRRGGVVIGFAYGLIFLREPEPWRKILCMLGILSGLICLALGSL